MNESPKTSGKITILFNRVTTNRSLVPSLEDHKAGLLDTPENDSTRRRSTSVSSARSAVTIIDNHSDVPVLDRKEIQRRCTQVAEVKISWWQCLKGVLLGPQVTERAARKTIIIPEAEEDDDVYGRSIQVECWVLTFLDVCKWRMSLDPHSPRRVF